ncbi:MAG: threonine/serine dehydratase [Synergistales bacterium]|nr:threonine/serine dehydratase [Synergistales bacterium]
MTLSLHPTITDVLQARIFLAGRMRHTPTEFSPSLSEGTGREIYLKWENRQICGSFKIRGALNKMYSLTEEERSRGVVTASSGNHAQGIAMAAGALEVRAAVCVPRGCPQTKRRAIERLGGDWVTLDAEAEHYDKAEERAHRLADEEGMTYVSSFNDHHVVCGAATLGLEMLLDVPDLDTLLVPAGGGGLINGVTLAARALRPGIDVWGVQSVASRPWVLSWEAGEIIEVDYDPSLADGLTGGFPQALFDLARRQGINGFFSVEEAEIAEAMRTLHREHHQVVEGAGAVGVAALLAGKAPELGRRVGVVLSGGNVDHQSMLGVLNGEI